MSLYNAKSTDDPSTYLFTKFDSDLNLVDDSIYLTTETTCTCPAGVRPSCRHRQMLPSFLATRRIDTPWFFDFDTGAWSQPFEALDDGEEAILPPVSGDVETIVDYIRTSAEQAPKVELDDSDHPQMRSDYKVEGSITGRLPPTKPLRRL